MQMCRTGVIPLEFYHFYKSLPSSSRALDKLCEPDTIEDESGNDTEDERIMLNGSDVSPVDM